MPQSTKKTIVAISGSLKSTSSNTSILHALEEMAGSDADFLIYKNLEDIPPFNPEKEEGNTAVKELRNLLSRADGLVISTPEYAFGVPGVLKNALDWLVSSGELNEKPVIAISASPMYLGGDKALASLLLTLGALGTRMNKNASMSIANISNKITAGKVTDPQTLKELKLIYDHLIEALTVKKEQS